MKQPEATNQLVVARQDDGKRLDNLLARYARYRPRDYLYKLIRSGQVRLDKKRASPSTRVAAGQSVRLPPGFFVRSQTGKTPPAALLEQVQQAVVYSDADLILVNKPSGVASHAGSRHPFGVVELLRAGASAECESQERQKPFPELVHRIDRLTSGCLLLAQHAQALQQLQQLWREQRVAKTYLALVHGHLSKSTKVALPLAVIASEKGKRVVVDHSQGKSAETRMTPRQYLLLEEVPVTLVECIPTGGRMHQIRVHCQSIGHPIVGDPLYQNRLQHRWSDKVCGETLLLHAQKLAFDWQGRDYSFCVAGEQRLTAMIPGKAGRIGGS